MGCFIQTHHNSQLTLLNDQEKTLFIQGYRITKKTRHHWWLLYLANKAKVLIISSSRLQAITFILQYVLRQNTSDSKTRNWQMALIWNLINSKHLTIQKGKLDNLQVFKIIDRGLPEMQWSINWFTLNVSPKSCWLLKENNYSYKRTFFDTSMKCYWRSIHNPISVVTLISL